MQRMNGAYREHLADISILASDDGTRASAEFVVHGEYLRSDAGLPPARGQRYVLPAGAFSNCATGALRICPTSTICRNGLRRSNMARLRDALAARAARARKQRSWPAGGEHQGQCA